MGKTACLLTAGDVPEYIKEIAKRLQPVLMDFQDDDGEWWGYTFRLDAKWKCGYESQLKADCDKLIKWCEKWHAHSKLIRHAWWYTDVEPPYGGHGLIGTKEHQRKALKEGWRNHAFLVISDPVAHQFEKDGFYRTEQKRGQ